MSLGNYQRCSVCRNYGWTNSHTCPPSWQARYVTHPDELDGWRTVYVTDADDAATKYMEDWESDGGWESITPGEDYRVEVRKGPGHPITVFSVNCELVRQYYERGDETEEHIEEIEEKFSRELVVGLVHAIRDWLNPPARGRDSYFDPAATSARHLIGYHTHLLELRGIDPDEWDGETERADLDKIEANVRGELSK